MSREREARKLEHVQWALQDASVSPTGDFDDIRFVHRSFPEIGQEDVDISTQVGPIRMNSPIYINAMTGGSRATEHVNRQLAEVVRETGIAMAVGSQHTALRDESLISTYRIVRDRNPDGIIFANIGAGAPLPFAQRAVDMLEAQALQIHVNVPQELVMPEGDKDFSGWLRKIESIVNSINVPVIVKEVGFGMSSETLQALMEIGVHIVDVGGRGGTDFAWIENQRRPNKEMAYLSGWGQSTAVSLLEAQPFLHHFTVMASGGIRHTLDMVKCLSLGASAVGVAGSVLRLLDAEGAEAVIARVNQWRTEMRSLFTLLGVPSVRALRRNPLVIGGNVLNWCTARGIDVKQLARR